MPPALRIDATAEGTMYQVRIAASNYAPGGALEGYVYTSGGHLQLRTSRCPPDLIYTYDT